MVNVAAWSWPQLGVVAMLAIHLLATAVRHGEERVDEVTNRIELHRFDHAAIRVALIAFLLAAGGFFR